MPRIRFHLPERTPPRQQECDVGFALALARRAHCFLQLPGEGRDGYEVRQRHETLYRGATLGEAVEFLRERLGDVC